MTREEKQKAIDALKISAPIMIMTEEKFNDYIQTLNKTMDWLEQEPTTKNDLGVDCISRQAVEDAMYDATRAMDLNYGQIMEYIDNLPSVTPQPRKGHWKDIPKYKDIAWQCSECEHFTTMKHSYCPECGAKMVEPQESEVEDGNDD